MRQFVVFIFLFSTVLYMMGCSAQQTAQKKEPQQTKEIPQYVNETTNISYDFTGRFLIPNSSILSDKSIEAVVDDPIVGEFVKFTKGDKNTFVFHKFNIDPNLKEKSNEVIFAFETSKKEIGIKIFPEKFVYYYLSYKDLKSRVDGEIIDGYIMLDTVNDNEISGNLNFLIEGNQKQFDQKDIWVIAEFKGNFKIPVVNINSLLK